MHDHTILLRLSAYFCQILQKLSWAHFRPQNVSLGWLKCFWKASGCVLPLKTNPKHIWIKFIRPKATLLSQLEHGHESRKICLQKSLKICYAFQRVSAKIGKSWHERTSDLKILVWSGLNVSEKLLSVFFYSKQTQNIFGSSSYSQKRRF